jgi:hypothetical protein
VFLPSLNAVQDQRRGQACWRDEEFALQERRFRPRRGPTARAFSGSLLSIAIQVATPDRRRLRWTTRARASRGCRFLIHHYVPDCPALAAASDETDLRGMDFRSVEPQT